MDVLAEEARGRIADFSQQNLVRCPGTLERLCPLRVKALHRILCLYVMRYPVSLARTVLCCSTVRNLTCSVWNHVSCACSEHMLVFCQGSSALHALLMHACACRPTWPGRWGSCRTSMLACLTPSRSTPPPWSR